MKGLIFRNFLDFVENQLGNEFLENMLDSTHSSTSGSYTNVGTYDHQELLGFIEYIHLETELPVDDMVEQFGFFLFHQLAALYPKLIDQYQNSFECIYHIDQTIHKNVTKIHPQAELPNLNATFSDNKNKLHLTYQSSRPFMNLALGLINGCINFYGDHVQVEMKDLSMGHDNHAEFILRCQTK